MVEPCSCAEQTGYLSNANTWYLLGDLLSGQTGSGIVSLLRSVSKKVKAEAKEALSTAGPVRNSCLRDVELEKTAASPAALRRLAFRLKTPKVTVYMEDWRRPT